MCMFVFVLIYFYNNPTRMSYNSISKRTTSTCIDHIFSRLNQDINFSTVVHDFEITDHKMIQLDLKYSINSNNISNKKDSHNVTKIDQVKLSYLLSSESWNSVFEQNDPNVAYDNFISMLKNMLLLLNVFLIKSGNLSLGSHPS